MKKKTICIFLLMLMLFSMTVPVRATYDRSYTAPKGTPIIDGEIDEVWHSAEWTDVLEVHDAARDTDSTLYIKLLWDEAHLYFLANVYDSTVNQRNDLVEIYIDQNDANTRYYEEDDFHTRFYVRKDGAINTGTASDGANGQGYAPSFAKDLGDNKFVIEGQLDWKGGTPSIGDVMGLEFMYNDGSEYESFVDAYRWNADTRSGDEPPYVSTEYFGTLTLADAGTPNEANNTLPAAAFEDYSATQQQVVVNKRDEMPKEETTGAVLWITVGVVVILVVAVIVIFSIRKKKSVEK